MKTEKIKTIISCMVLLLMLGYVGLLFYASEPKYIDNCDNTTLKRYDYVSIQYGGYEVFNGIVLQVGDNKALVKSKRHSFTESFYELDMTLKDKNYRVVGEGTFYHKINNYVGFNLMLISQIFIGILCAIMMISILPGLKKVFG